MTTRSKSIKKQLKAIKYSLGFLVLTFIGVMALFVRTQTLSSPAVQTPKEMPPQNADWRCPGNAWVQCNAVDESMGVSCEKEYITWAIESCAGFQGVVN